MRAWLFNLLTGDSALQTLMGEANAEAMKNRVIPRESRDTINIRKPYLVYGLGNDTNENLAEDNDHVAHRQFFQVWAHDEGGDFQLIDDILERVKLLLNGAQHPPSKVTNTRWLETSQEFSNQTYNTIFRYARFQAVISKGAAA